MNELYSLRVNMIDYFQKHKNQMCSRESQRKLFIALGMMRSKAR